MVEPLITDVEPFCPIRTLAESLWAERPNGPSWRDGDRDARSAYVLFASDVVQHYFMADQIAGRA